MDNKKEAPLSRKVGSFLAIIQSIVDNLFGFFFKMLKGLGGKKESRKNPTSLKGKVIGAAHDTVNFLGEAGDSYYETYEKLKARKH